jgi:hypothetical protein
MVTISMISGISVIVVTVVVSAHMVVSTSVGIPVFSMIVRTVPVLAARIDGAWIAVIARGTRAHSELPAALARLRRVILHGVDVDPAEPGEPERDVAHLDQIGDGKDPPAEGRRDVVERVGRDRRRRAHEKIHAAHEAVP